MLAFYPQIKAVHVAAVLLSGALFLMRGLLVQAGRQRIGDVGAAFATRATASTRCC